MKASSQYSSADLQSMLAEHRTVKRELEQERKGRADAQRALKLKAAEVEQLTERLTASTAASAAHSRPGEAGAGSARRARAPPPAVSKPAAPSRAGGELAQARKQVTVLEAEVARLTRAIARDDAAQGSRVLLSSQTVPANSEQERPPPPLAGDLAEVTRAPPSLLACWGQAMQSEPPPSRRVVERHLIRCGSRARLAAAALQGTCRRWPASQRAALVERQLWDPPRMLARVTRPPTTRMPRIAGHGRSRSISRRKRHRSLLCKMKRKPRRRGAMARCFCGRKREARRLGCGRSCPAAIRAGPPSLLHRPECFRLQGGSAGARS